ncbi:MAG: AMP-binding protein [Gammaproteobacteria bacterium]|nr:AMP-binding protein [Gammaproteobacteria bacterium]
MNVSHWIAHHAAQRPDALAVACEDRSCSYAQLWSAIVALSDALTRGCDLGPGSRVAYLGHNSPELLILLFACARAGCIFLPLNWRMAPPEHAAILRDAAPAALFVEPGFIQHAESAISGLPAPILISHGDASPPWRSLAELLADRRPGPAPLPDTPAAAPLLLCYTSGTSGTPKGALLTQQALFWNAVNSTLLHDLTRNDHVLTVLPMFHVGGLNIQTLPALHAGAGVTLLRRFTPDAFFDCLDRRPVSLSLFVPTVLSALMQDPRWHTADFSCLRSVGIGSTITPEGLIRAATGRRLPLYQVYGATETCPIAAHTTPEETARNPLTTGRAAMHCQLRFVDDRNEDVPAGVPGEILVRGQNVFSGYWNDAAATAAAFTDGWFHTGDIGRRDANDLVYIVGRSKDMIISGGENVYPAVVENVLSEIPDLAEVTVVGRPDEFWGEVVVAVAVARAGHPRDPAKVLEWCCGRIAGYEHPREVLFVDALPRNAMGKVMKDQVRQMVVERASDRIPVAERSQ